jgi:hypothetical protein
MIDFLLLLIFGMAWTWGIHCLFAEGYLLESVGNVIRRNVPKWAMKPTIDCAPCMASIHGFAISAIYFDWHIFPMLAYIICLCGVNFIIKSILFPEYE